MCVGAVPGGMYCGELGAVARCVATMQESYQHGQWIDGMCAAGPEFNSH